jgi:hypothetical protein
MMITVRQKIVVLAFTALAMTALTSACGASGHTVAAGASSASTAAAQQTCQQVSAVLSDGPDPGADPVGYAEAQILPLEQIRASDSEIGQAITTLADAYTSYFTADGSGKTATSDLNKAINRINSLCPGAGATT